MSNNEILTIRLGYRKAGETRVGWVPNMTDDEIWAAGSAWWVLKASRAVECETLLILDPECVVIAVADVLGVRKEFKAASRFEILGDRYEDHEYLGKVVARGKSQNPVAYVTPDQIA
ncbi:hypothetical protein TSOC111612_11400 [Tsukamurella ocularis]|uniref:hypothetical protein n=1 Tax=Tsukamurella ocularis TaxID=1970234 RepID=UPI0039EFFDDE